jgi:hypothetical protein
MKIGKPRTAKKSKPSSNEAADTKRKATESDSRVQLQAKKRKGGSPSSLETAIAEANRVITTQWMDEH